MVQTTSIREGRILLVDDERANVDLLLRALRDDGYREVRGTSDSDRVPELVGAFGPDVILLDLQMPHPDGFEVLERLADRLSPDAYLPVLVLTADLSSDVRRRAVDAGATDFLRKPFDLDEVILRTANALELRRLRVRSQERDRELEEDVRGRTAELERALGAEREAIRHLRALDEMKTTFLTAVSHELRTPLSSVLGGALTLERSASVLNRQQQSDIVGGVVKNARRLNVLLADLLDVDRLARGMAGPVRRPTDVRVLIDKVVEDSELPADHPVHVDADHLTVEVDASKVERIVQNLLFNAVRHTPPGTGVHVSARMDGRGLLLAVDDEGPGVAEDLREVIFEPFRRGPEQNGDGPGIGLSLVSRFASLHGGRAWVEDRPGGGASFRVFIPAAVAASAS